MTRIIVNNDTRSGFKWHVLGNVHVKGYAYVNDDYKEGKELAEHFLSITEETDFVEKMKNLNGIISVIIKINEKVFAAVDRFGIFDLFYSNMNDDVYVSDMAANIIKYTKQTELNQEGKKDFIYCGFICHGETLMKNVYSINASKYAVIEKDVRINTYHELKYHVTEGQHYHELKKSFDEVVHKVAKRFVASLGNREVYVPLSGGMDSRFILLLLNKMNYKNVTCFTYGSLLFGENAIARRVAEENGFKFLHIPYQRKKWKDFFADHKHEQFLLYASNYQCMAHLMDYFAASELDLKNCVVVPGHVGSIADSHINKAMTKDDFTDFLINKYMFFYSKNNRNIHEYLKKRISAYLDGFKETDSLYRQNEIFDFIAYDTYRSKHLFKALKAYDYHNVEWRVPLMDNDILEFMYSLELKFRGPEKAFLGQYISERISEKVKFSKKSKLFFLKVMKNFFDRRYSVLSYRQIRKMEVKGVELPKGCKFTYRMYRNFLSYIAIKNYLLIERKLDEQN